MGAENKNGIPTVNVDEMDIEIKNNNEDISTEEVTISNDETENTSEEASAENTTEEASAENTEDNTNVEIEKVEDSVEDAVNEGTVEDAETEVVEESKEDTELEISEDKVEENPKVEVSKDSTADEALATKEFSESVSITHEEPYVDSNAINKFAKRKKITIITLASILGAIFVVYIGFVIFFSNHFFFDTKIAGVDVSMKSVSEATKLVNSVADNYSLTISEIDGDKTIINREDADIKVVVDSNMKDICKKQNSFAWLFNINSSYNYNIDVTVTYDENKLIQTIDSLPCMQSENMVSPVNPILKYEDGQYIIVEEVEGSTINKDNFTNAIIEALNAGENTLIADDANVYVRPEYTSESQEVIDALNELNSYANMVITYKMGENLVPIGLEEIHNWLTISSSYEVSYSVSKIGKFVHDFAEKYDTYGKERTFTTSKRKTIKVLGKYMGWQIDQEAEVEALETILQDGYSIHREPEYSQVGITYGDENDIGNTYIEVDLTNQHVYAYKNGRLFVDGDIVSGNVALRHTTPAGLYQIKYKQSPAVLRGKKLEDGTYEYESPVTYWMPFNGGIGLHDADGWRSRYGGSIYLRAGSHGCVNMPRSVAKEIYKNFDAGTPVVCYYYED